MKKKTPPVGILTTVKEEKKMKPIVIEDTLKYKISISDEGYQIEVEPRIHDDLAATLITRNIVERFVVDMKYAKTLNVKGQDHKFISERLAKLAHTSYGLKVVATDIMLSLINKVQREESAEEYVKAKKDVGGDTK